MKVWPPPPPCLWDSGVSFALSAPHAHVVAYCTHGGFQRHWIVAVWCARHAPRYAWCAETSRGVQWLGLLGSSLISAKEMCLGPIGAGALRLLVGALWRCSVRPERTGFGCNCLSTGNLSVYPSRQANLENFITTAHGGGL